MIYKSFDECKGLPLKRAEGFVEGGYFYYLKAGQYLKTYLNYSSSQSVSWLAIPDNKTDLNLAQAYPVIRNPQKAASNYILYKNTTYYDVFYPNGTILYNNGTFIVTTGVTNVRNFGGNTYSKLYPWCPNVAFSAGDFVVWDGGIYQCTADDNGLVPPSDSASYNLVQNAPLCKIGAVIPLVLFDAKFELCCPYNSFISSGVGARQPLAEGTPTPMEFPDWGIRCYTGNSAAWFADNMLDATYSFKYVANVGVNNSGGLGGVGATLWISLGDGGQFPQKIYTYYDDCYFSCVPEALYGAISDYGVSLGTLGMPFHDGNTLQVPVSNYVSGVNSNFYTDLTLDTTVTMNCGKMPLLIADLVGKPASNPSVPSDEYTVYFMVSNSYMYDAYSLCIRRVIHHSSATYQRVYPTWSDHFNSTGLFYMYNEFPNQQNTVYSFCCGYILPQLANLAFFDATDNFADVTGTSLLAGAFAGYKVGSCLYELYHVDKDDKSAMSSSQGFLRNPKYCTYIGKVDVCQEIVYSISLLPGINIKINSGNIIYSGGKIYIANSDFTSSGNPATDIASGKLTELKPNDKGLIEVTKDQAQIIGSNGGSIVEDTVVYKESNGDIKSTDNKVIATENPDEVNGEGTIFVEPMPSYSEGDTLTHDIFDACDFEQTDIDGIYRTKSAIPSYDSLSEDNTTFIGVRIAGMYLYNLSVVKSVKKNNYFIDNGHIYLALADLTSVSNTNAKLVGEQIAGVYAFYWDYVDKPTWQKDMYIIYNKILEKYPDGYILRSLKEQYIDNTVNENYYRMDISSRFEVAGEGYSYNTDDCDTVVTDYFLYYSAYPDCYIIPAGDTVIDIDKNTGQKKVIRIVKPVGGGLDTTGQVLAAYKSVMSS